MELAPVTWPEIEDAGPVDLLVPVGSCEQHGPHLPLDTDTRIAVAVARGVAERFPAVAVAPAVAYGASGEHQGFPGTLSIGTEALTGLLVELGRSAFPGGDRVPFRRLVLVNGHGGNHAAASQAVAVLAAEGRAVDAWFPTVDGGDAHAGRTETSLLLAVAPEHVRDDRPPGNTESLDGLMATMRSDGVGAVSATGILGNPAGATAEEGHRILAALIDDLVALLGLPAGG